MLTGGPCWRTLDSLFPPSAVSWALCPGGAVLAVADGDTVRLDRYPATVQGPGEDLWRVHDQGVFRPELIRSPLAARLPAGVVVAVSWPGAEGENVYLLAPGTDPRGEAPDPGAPRWGRWHRGYRYLAPE